MWLYKGNFYASMVFFEESEFDGKLAELLGINILSFLLIIVTLGIGFHGLCV